MHGCSVDMPAVLAQPAQDSIACILHKLAEAVLHSQPLHNRLAGALLGQALKTLLE